MNERLVTVLVTVFNIEQYLDRFFDCLKNQSMTDYEVLIIDDGSSDNSLAVCQKYAETDDRIRIISVNHIGISAARNLAIEKIRTEFVTSLDGDDYFEKDYLKHLVDAQKKYDADLVISNVIYRRESGKETGRFKPCEEALYKKEDFPTKIPLLLEENRLNYLYGKLYRKKYMDGIRVSSDVRQGSDTMINFQYLLKIQSIAVIADYDYNYVNYTKRSVTSYNGNDVFKRLLRINEYISDLTKSNGYLNDEMLRVIDGRILLSGRHSLKCIARTAGSRKAKYKKASTIINSNEYLSSYERQKQRGNIESFMFNVIVPGKEKAYINSVCDIVDVENRDRRKRKLRQICPDFLFNIYHRAKIKLGLIPPDAK